MTALSNLPDLPVGRDEGGNTVFCRDGHHLLTVAKTDSGKTVSVLMPAIRASTGLVVTCSTKDELARYALAKHQQSRHMLLAPTSPPSAWTGTGLTFTHFDPVGSVRGSDDTLTMAEAFCDTAFRAQPGREDTNQFFIGAAARFLSAALLAARIAGHPTSWAYDVVAGMHIGRLVEAMSPRDQDGVPTSARTDQSPPANAATGLTEAELRALRQGPPKGVHAPDWAALQMMAGVSEGFTVAAFAEEALRAWHREAMRSAEGTALRIDIDELLQPADPVRFVHVVVPRFAAAAAGPVVAAFLDLLAGRHAAAHDAAGRGQSRTAPPPLTLIADEVGVTAPWAGLPDLAAEGRGRRARVVAAAQSRAQLNDRFGDERARVLVENCDLLIGTVSDRQLLEDVAALSGDDWDDQQTTSLMETGRGAQRVEGTTKIRSTTWTAGTLAHLNAPGGERHAVFVQQNRLTKVRLIPAV